MPDADTHFELSSGNLPCFRIKNIFIRIGARANSSNDLLADFYLLLNVALSY